MTRRDFVALSSMAAAFAAASCSRGGGGSAAPAEPVAPPADPLVLRYLNRAGFGPAVGDVEAVTAAGWENALEEQLFPETIDDSALDAELADLSIYHLPLAELQRQDTQDVLFELGYSTMLRAFHSKRQLEQVMVSFWSDHFHISLGKNPFIAVLKTIDDRDVIRPNAMGRFRDLLYASVQSPAMLAYLDNVLNVGSSPNENYARELLELHTLGVDAGYTQADVEDLARALTGWTITSTDPVGEFIFNLSVHDLGPKQVLGLELPGGEGQEELLRVLDLLAEHPATARTVATKMVRKFVADDPPATLVEAVTNTYLSTDGDIRSMLRTIFYSPEFLAAPPKFKRPFQFAVSGLRALDADRDLFELVLEEMTALGQPLGFWPLPDGYPDNAESLLSTTLNRWRMLLQLFGGNAAAANAAVASITADSSDSFDALRSLTRRILHRPLDAAGDATLRDYTIGASFDTSDGQQRLRDATAMLLAHPDFQWT